jgi:hypothetical protein
MGEVSSKIWIGRGLSLRHEITGFSFNEAAGFIRAVRANGVRQVNNDE